jgi:hypothetical protein
MKKNQERRLHRKNAKIVKEGGMPMQLNRPIKPETTVRCLPFTGRLFLTFVHHCRGGAATVAKWGT